MQPNQNLENVKEYGFLSFARKFGYMFKNKLILQQKQEQMLQKLHQKE